MKVQSKKENAELIIELRFDAHDQLCLNHDLLDIVDWYSKGPALEKIDNCRTRMIKENKDQLLASKGMESKTMAQMNVILNDPIALCDAICKMDGYKNRSQRDANQ